VSRLFVAVWPPEDVVDELTSLRRKDQRGVRFVAPDNWHITLRFFGEADIDAVVAAMDGAALPATTARLGPGVDVLAERAVVVPVDGLDDLAQIVNDRTRAVGEPPRKRFIGHLTLARVKRHAAMPPVVGAFVTATFDVAEIALVQSRLHPAGARYETVHTWPVG
jgi:2'-5' RNA ligase